LTGFDRALQLKPDFARAYAQKANELINVGRPQEAPPMVEKAIELNPNSPSLGMYYWIIGKAHFFAGNYSESIKWLEKSIVLRGNLWYSRLYLISALAITGQNEKAKEGLNDLNAKFGQYTLTRVASDELANPNNHAVIIAGRRSLHEGLRSAGMPAHAESAPAQYYASARTQPVRYVMSNRRAGKYRQEQMPIAFLMSRLGAIPSAKPLVTQAPEDPAARRAVVFEAEPQALEAKRETFSPDVIIEPEIIYYPAPSWPSHTQPSDFLPPHQIPPAHGTGTGSPLQITVRGDGKPLPDALVVLYCRGTGGAERVRTGTTDAQGRVDLNVDLGFVPAAAVAVPQNTFWTMILRAPDSRAVIECPPLPRTGPTAWWHKASGIDRADLIGGQGIKIGIIDSGCGPHPSLAHVRPVGAFIDYQRLPPNSTLDVDGHGSHTTGIIGARPTNPGDYAGFAPGAELYAARVFDKGKGANQEDIASAIDVLSRESECDLLNLSLAAPQRSNILEDAIRDALEHGTLCVCAAGNDAGPPNYPAAYADCVGVSAIGLSGWGPPGSLSWDRLPDKRELYGQNNYYFANFSCFGSGITCVAPGVGIISAVPDPTGQEALYMAMDGTSMACPVVCGSLSILLARDAVFGTMPRDLSRATAARALLISACRSIGLASEYEGRGIPTLRNPAA
jgi:subtilisin